jgi:hypothetical protein
MSRHAFPLVESIKVIHLSDGRTIRVVRDRTEENLKTNYGDGDIHLVCVSQAHDPVEMVKTLARMESVRSVELVDSKGNGLVVHKQK